MGCKRLASQGPRPLHFTAVDRAHGPAHCLPSPHTLTRALGSNDGQHRPHEQQLGAGPLQGKAVGKHRLLEGAYHTGRSRETSTLVLVARSQPASEVPRRHTSSSSAPHLKEQRHGPASPDDERPDANVQHQHGCQCNRNPKQCVPQRIQGGVILQKCVTDGAESEGRNS